MNKKNEIDTTKAKSWLGLSACLLIIIVLIVLIRTSPNVNNNTRNTSNNKSNKTNINNNVNNNEDNLILKNLNNNNYKFIYTFSDNGTTCIYEGRIKDNKSEIKIISNNITNTYYKLGSTYLDSNYNSIDNPFIYDKYYNISNLENLLMYGEEDINNNIHTYKIAVFDILDTLFPNIYYDSFETDDLNDDIIEVKYNNEEVEEINIDLSNTLSYINKTNTIFKADLIYSNINNVEDINIG